jgi:hypothetical protein
MKKFIYLFLFCYTPLSFAQEAIDSGNTKEYAEETIKKDERKNSFAISSGFPGFAIDYARKINQSLSAKIRYNFLKIENYNAGKFDISGNNILGTVSGESSTLDFLVEYLPFENSSFKFVGGLGIISKMNIDILMEYDESVTFGDVVLSKEDYGNLNIGFAWESIAPYLGLGFGRAVPKRRLGFGIEVGCYYSSSPNITLDATKLLAPTADQEYKVQETFKTWKFIPLLQLRLAYAF